MTDFKQLFLAGLVACLSLLGSAHAATLPETEPAFIEIKAEGKSMEDTLADLKRAIASHNYVYIREQAVDMGLVSKDTEDRNIMIVYFCNFGMLDTGLKADKMVGMYLPCRVTLIREPDGVRLVVMNPKFVGRSLGDTNLTDICDRLQFDYTDILNEASL